MLHRKLEACGYKGAGFFELSAGLALCPDCSAGVLAGVARHQVEWGGGVLEVCGLWPAGRLRSELCPAMGRRPYKGARFFVAASILLARGFHWLGGQASFGTMPGQGAPAL